MNFPPHCCRLVFTLSRAWRWCWYLFISSPWWLSTAKELRSAGEKNLTSPARKRSSFIIWIWNGREIAVWFFSVFCCCRRCDDHHHVSSQLCTTETIKEREARTNMVNATSEKKRLNDIKQHHHHRVNVAKARRISQWRNCQWPESFQIRLKSAIWYSSQFHCWWTATTTMAKTLVE